MNKSLVLILIIMAGSAAVFGEAAKRNVQRYTTCCSTILNGRAISLPEPVYPEAALDAGAQGVVRVRVLIDEHGNVVSAPQCPGLRC